MTQGSRWATVVKNNPGGRQKQHRRQDQPAASDPNECDRAVGIGLRVCNCRQKHTRKLEPPAANEGDRDTGRGLKVCNCV